MTSREAVIGLEIHVQLKTVTKLFCGDLTEFGAAPNSHVCPVCLGLPGALPTLNRRAVELGLRAALALQCTIRPVSRFARKNYFYPDLPKGYQITQYADPLAVDGTVRLADGSHVRIRRVHLEEDAGKLLHDRLADRTAIDMNRAGAPLLEIVTEPDLTSPAHARAFLGLLKRTLQYAAVSDCEMEKGTLRVDANVSLSEADASRDELKNLNSFAAIERALAAALSRRRAALSAGRLEKDQTLGWNDVAAELHVMRAKEHAADYRYMDEPDLPPLVLDETLLGSAADLPELPLVRAERFERQYGLSRSDCDALTATRSLADYFEQLVALTGDARAAAAWTRREVLGVSNPQQTEFAVSAERLAELIGLVNAGVLTGTAARHGFRRMAETGHSASEIVEAEGLDAAYGAADAEAWAREIIAAHERELTRLRAGESRIIEFFVGELMRKAGGRLDHRVARAAVLRAIQAG